MDKWTSGQVDKYKRAANFKFYNFIFYGKKKQQQTQFLDKSINTGIEQHPSSEGSIYITGKEIRDQPMGML